MNQRLQELEVPEHLRQELQPVIPQVQGQGSSSNVKNLEALPDQEEEKDNSADQQ